MNKLISHEYPLALMDNNANDYLYVLLHKYLEDEEYRKKAIAYRERGGLVYLDNSCYELGESLDNDVLYQTFRELNSQIVILPDVLGNKNDTIRRTTEFLRKYPQYKQNYMVVAQGATAEELIECYFMFSLIPDCMIGIPFVYSWLPKQPDIQARGRIELLRKMVDEKIIDTSKRHHLLGTWQVNEFLNYKSYDWIYSIDTSNPIMAAIDQLEYITGYGIDEKPKATFDSSYLLTESDINMNLLYNNVYKFRSIVNG